MTRQYKNQFSDITFEQRLNHSLSKCIRTNSGCLEWTGARAGRGLYPVIRDENSKQKRVSRIMLEHSGRTRPSDKHIACHTCDNPNCIEPMHLFWGTVQDNAIDMVKKNRHNIPSGEHRKKMDEKNSERMKNPEHRARVMKDLVRGIDGRWKRKEIKCKNAN